jgi:hypothetical protein
MHDETARAITERVAKTFAKSPTEENSTSLRAVLGSHARYRRTSGHDLTLYELDGLARALSLVRHDDTHIGWYRRTASQHPDSSRQFQHLLMKLPEALLIEHIRGPLYRMSPSMIHDAVMDPAGALVGDRIVPTAKMSQRFTRVRIVEGRGLVIGSD